MLLCKFPRVAYSLGFQACLRAQASTTASFAVHVQHDTGMVNHFFSFVVAFVVIFLET
jgi:hypothetical protein